MRYEYIIDDSNNI